MNASPDLEIFLVTAPGLETLLCAEAAEKGFRAPKAIAGGVTISGNWSEVWRANLQIRGASKVLVRIAAFRVMHLAQLDKRAHKVAWGEILKPGLPIHVEATCKASRIYHQKAAAERIGKAIAEELGAPIADDAAIRIKARIHDDFCTISLDTSGELLHRRGHKEAVNKAPMRENLAALFLRHCGYDGVEPVIDPMCGSGTFVIEAAEIAANLQPGRSRDFAFQQFANFDTEVWARMQGKGAAKTPANRYFGFDRDAGAVRMSQANAERAGVDAFATFGQQTISDLTPPEGPPGLVIVNPPYGARVGHTKPLHTLYRALGNVLKDRFSGWRVGLVTNEPKLAEITGLPFAHETAPVSHGGIRVKVYATDRLA